MDSWKCARKQITSYLVRGEKTIKESINLEGLVCPLPVARTKKKLNELNSGDILEVNGDFAEAGENIKRYVESHGDKIIDFRSDGENYFIQIQKT